MREEIRKGKTTTNSLKDTFGFPKLESYIKINDQFGRFFSKIFIIAKIEFI